MKKQSSSKTNKAISKNLENNRDLNSYSCKNLPQTRDISQISHLQRRLNQQINARQQSFNQLFEMIKHLDETKKSKLPANYYKISSKKIISSPHKCHTATSIQKEQIAQFKSQIAQLATRKQIEQNNHKTQIKQLQKQIKILKNQIQQNRIFRQNIAQAVVQLGSKLTQVSKVKSQINQKPSREQIQQKNNKIYSTINKMQAETSSRINQLQQFKINLTHLTQQFKQFKQDILDNQHFLNQKFEDYKQEKQQSRKLLYKLFEGIQGSHISINDFSTQLSNILVSLTSLQQSKQKLSYSLQQMSQKIQSQFESLTRQISSCSSSINQTKQNIEQIMYGESRQREKSEKSNFRLSRGQSQVMEKIRHAETRVEGLERRVDFLYQDLVTRPLIAKSS